MVDDMSPGTATTPEPALASSEFDRAVQTRRGEDGRRHLDLTADWNTPNGTANGGYLLAVLLRAVLDEAATTAPAHPDPLSVSVSYLRPPAVGPAELDVTTLRVGRRVSVHEVGLVQADRLIAHAVVSLHDWDAAGDAQHTPHTAPQVPSADAGVDPSAAIPAGTVPIVDRFDARAAEVPGWLRGEPSGEPEAHVWLRPRDGRRIDGLAAAAMVDAYPPVTAELGLISSATVQLTVHLRRRPDTEWALLHVVTRHVIDGFHDEDVELWDDQGRLIAQSRQLAVLA